MSCTIVKPREPFLQIKLGSVTNKILEPKEVNSSLTNDKSKSESVENHSFFKGIMSHERLLGLLETIREPIADYQEKRGLSKTENYGFLLLCTSMCQHSYSVIVTIIAMLCNLLPLLEGFMFLGRFVLDSCIEICRTEDYSDKILKTIVFVGQLIVLFFLLMSICGFILLPVWYLFSHIFGKLYGMALTSAS